MVSPKLASLLQEHRLDLVHFLVNCKVIQAGEDAAYRLSFWTFLDQDEEKGSGESVMLYRLYEVGLELAKYAKALAYDDNPMYICCHLNPKLKPVRRVCQWINGMMASTNFGVFIRTYMFDLYCLQYQGEENLTSILARNILFLWLLELHESGEIGFTPRPISIDELLLEDMTPRMEMMIVQGVLLAKLTEMEEPVESADKDA